MKKLLIIIPIVLMGCQTTYTTPKGDRLLGNTAAGCIFGQVFFDNCAAGAAVTGAATLIDDQTDG